MANENFIIVDHINGYLMPNAPDIYVMKRATPFFNVPEMSAGSKPVDGGNLLLTPDERGDLVKKNPLAAKWIRPFVGGREFINRIPRYCLWLEGCQPDELRKMPLVYERVKNVREYRLQSKKAETRKKADTPTLFAERRQPTTNYIFIPQVSSSRRRFIPIGYLSPEFIAAQGLTVPDANLFHFGVLTSSVHMAWVRMVAGRLKSDYRYSATICYNPFPWPLFYTDEQQKRIEATAQAILDARANYPNATYADLYDEVSMPADLRKAHTENDREVMKAYRFREDIPELAMQIVLLNSYQTLHEEFDLEDDE
ncbi:MAG: hypothetical protein IJG33_10230 [Selenomonadaceae bacterium]|nr:hypothetical protein [Selenomonadaceae bacterium]